MADVLPPGAPAPQLAMMHPVFIPEGRTGTGSTILTTGRAVGGVGNAGGIATIDTTGPAMIRLDNLWAGAPATLAQTVGVESMMFAATPTLPSASTGIITGIPSDPRIIFAQGPYLLLPFGGRWQVATVFGQWSGTLFEGGDIISYYRDLIDGVGPAQGATNDWTMAANQSIAVVGLPATAQATLKLFAHFTYRARIRNNDAANTCIGCAGLISGGAGTSGISIPPLTTVDFDPPLIWGKGFHVKNPNGVALTITAMVTVK